MSARIYELPWPPQPDRHPHACRDCGEMQPEPLDRLWPWCLGCGLERRRSFFKKPPPAKPGFWPTRGRA